MDLSHYYGVIMAGGGGTRMWPFSRRDRPKQMIRLGSQRTLFQQAVDRLVDLIPFERILVVTVASQAAELQKQVPELPVENYLIEPAPRGTASVVGMAALALRHRDPQSTMAVVTADHLIQNEPYFRQVLVSAFDVAQEGFLVTLGIHPTYPATGYGYIQRGNKLGDFQSIAAYRAERFLEKPNLERAKEFILRGDHAWNSGMFIWRTERIWQEISGLMPDLAGKLAQIELAWGKPEQRDVLHNVWLTIQPQTVDYGIMERAAQVAVIPAEGLGWNDVGAWDSLFDVFTPDDQENVVIDARHVGLDTHGSLIVAEDSDRLVVTIGVDDLVVVETKDATLICPRHQVQKVRELVDMLKKGQDPQVVRIKEAGIDPERFL